MIGSTPLAISPNQATVPKPAYAQADRRAQRPRQEHRADRAQCDDDRHRPDVLAVDQRDDDQGRDVVDHEHRQQEDARPPRYAAPDQRQQTECQRGVGRHRDAPGVRARTRRARPRRRSQRVRPSRPVRPRTASRNRRRSRRSPRSNSRRASSPTTRKNSVISPLFTQVRSSRVTPQWPRCNENGVVHADSYEPGATVHHTSADDDRGDQDAGAARLGTEEGPQRRRHAARPLRGRAEDRGR